MDFFERKRVCMELARRRAAEDSKGLPAGMSLISPTFCYSDTLKTCLYFGGFLRGNKASMMTIDLLTNESLAETFPDNPRVGLSWPDYQEEVKEFRSRCAP
jgi:hypothetical protein